MPRCQTRQRFGTAGSWSSSAAVQLTGSRLRWLSQEEAQFRLQIFKFRRWLQAAEGPEGALGGRVRREAHELLKRAEKGLRSLRGGGK